MNPRIESMSRPAVERETNNGSYLYFENISELEKDALSYTANLLGLNGLCNLTVEEVPNIFEDENACSLRLSKDASYEDLSDNQIGRLMTAWYIANGALYNSPDLQNKARQRAVIAGEIDLQVKKFAENPEVYREFVRVVQHKEDLKHDPKASVTGYEILDLLYLLEQDGGSISGDYIYSLTDYPSIALWLYDIHRDYKGVTERILESDSEIGHELILSTMDSELKNIDTSAADPEQMQSINDLYIGPLLYAGTEENGVLNPKIQECMIHIFQKFFDPKNGEFRDLRHTAGDLYAFVQQTRFNFLKLFLGSTNEELNGFFTEYFQNTTHSTESRVSLIRFAENLPKIHIENAKIKNMLTMLVGDVFRGNPGHDSILSYVIARLDGGKKGENLNTSLRSMISDRYSQFNVNILEQQENSDLRDRELADMEHDMLLILDLYNPLSESRYDIKYLQWVVGFDYPERVRQMAQEKLDLYLNLRR